MLDLSCGLQHKQKNNRTITHGTVRIKDEDLVKHTATMQISLTYTTLHIWKYNVTMGAWVLLFMYRFSSLY